MREMSCAELRMSTTLFKKSPIYFFSFFFVLLDNISDMDIPIKVGNHAGIDYSSVIY